VTQTGKGQLMATAAETAAMRRALELATRGPSRGVNPRVGCVILSAHGEVLAEGWHRGAGTAHAEVDALSRLAPGAAQGATAVVTLEPCNHTGRTGPGAIALIEAGIARIVYAVADPSELAPLAKDPVVGILNYKALLRARRHTDAMNWLTTSFDRLQPETLVDVLAAWLASPPGR
jgi:pyrimidine deaminase RibD-like protein